MLTKNENKKSLEKAISYAEMGYPVFAVHSVEDGHCTCGNPDCSYPGKHPHYHKSFLTNGKNSATTDTQTIKKWFEMWPNANIGIKTGREAGIAVLDFDIKDQEGINGVQIAEENYDWQPGGPYQKTGGGGLHAFYKRPDTDDKVKTGHIEPGIEIIADGGAVVVAPSTHESGECYEWEEPLKDPADLPELPEWASNIEDEENTTQCVHKKTEDLGEIIPKGERNSTLFRLAGDLRRKGMEESEISDSLKSINRNRCTPPLSKDEIAIIAQSICSYPSGDISGDAQHERQLIKARNNLIERVKHDRDSTEVFDAVPIIAELPEGLFNETKTQLKEILGNNLNLNDLMRAVKNARKQNNKIKGEMQMKEQRKDGDLVVDCTNKTIPEVADEVIDIIKDHHVIFKMNRKLARIAYDDEEHPIIEKLDKGALRSQLASEIKFWKDGRQLDYPPTVLAEDVLNQPHWSLYPLKGITQVPIIRSDGSVLQAKGYDKNSGFFYKPSKEITGINIPESPSKNDISNAIETIFDYLQDFPFKTRVDKANYIGMVLTPICKELIDGYYPCFGIKAPKKRTGKTKLANIFGYIILGQTIVTITRPKREEEWQKIIPSYMQYGYPTVLIDNADGTIDSEALASAITTKNYTGRTLGKTDITLPKSHTIWVATGTGLRFVNSMANRAVMINIDAKMSKPWLRSEFVYPNIEKTVMENRELIVASLLALVRSWVASGKPEPEDLSTFGGFEDWAETIGGILEHVGIEGFLENQNERVMESDHIDLEWESFLLKLYHFFDKKPFTSRQVCNSLKEDNDDHHSDGQYISIGVLPDELADNWMDDSRFSKKLGNAFRKHEDERYGDSGVRVVRSDTKNNAIVWAIKADVPIPPNRAKTTTKC